MRYFLYGIGAVILAAIIQWIRLSIKAAKDPDVIEASNLKMDVRHYRKYKEIYNEQLACFRKGEEPPNRMNEIPNMNEWRRFRIRMEEKIREDMMNERNKY